MLFQNANNIIDSLTIAEERYGIHVQKHANGLYHLFIDDVYIDSFSDATGAYDSGRKLTTLDEKYVS